MEALLLRPNELASALGVSRSQAYLMLQRGDLPVIRIGRSVRVSREALEQWIRDQAEASARSV